MTCRSGTLRSWASVVAVLLAACGGSDPAPRQPAPATAPDAGTPQATPGLDGTTVTDEIRRTYLGGLKRCYKNSLKVDPTIAGKVQIDFEVSETGQGNAIEVTAPVPDLETCVASQVDTWTFAVPKDDDGDPTSAQFRITLDLATD